MDDTVLQTHRVNPRLIQVILLANGMFADAGYENSDPKFYLKGNRR